MQKIPTLFARNHETDHLVRDEVTPGCEWVLAGEGVATRKVDGTCCLVRDHVLYRRHEVREGRTAPPRFEEAARDETTGKRFGWVPVGDGPEDRWHREAFTGSDLWPDGTYELLGPKIQNNPERLRFHVLIRHGRGIAGPLVEDDPPRTFAECRGWFARHDVEGIVWHHPDGRMAKLKARDFGLKRERRAQEKDHA